MQSEDTWMEQHVLKGQGWSIAAFASEFGLDWRTAELAHVERRLAACPDLRATILLREFRDAHGLHRRVFELRRRVVGL